MGQYVQIGICQKINIFKCDMEKQRVALDEVLNSLNKEVDLDLYKMNESDSGYTFTLKEKYLESKDLGEFLSEQYMLSVDNKEQEE